VIQVAKDVSLAGQAGLFLRRDAGLTAHDLERDEASRFFVDCPVYDARAAAPDLALDAEPSSERAPWRFRRSHGSRLG
jgi:hypothetical protein